MARSSSLATASALIVVVLLTAGTPFIPPSSSFAQALPSLAKGAIANVSAAVVNSLFEGPNSLPYLGACVKTDAQTAVLAVEALLAQKLSSGDVEGALALFSTKTVVSVDFYPQLNTRTAVEAWLSLLVSNNATLQFQSIGSPVVGCTQAFDTGVLKLSSLCDGGCAPGMAPIPGIDSDFFSVATSFESGAWKISQLVTCVQSSTNTTLPLVPGAPAPAVKYSGLPLPGVCYKIEADRLHSLENDFAAALATGQVSAAAAFFSPSAVVLADGQPPLATSESIKDWLSTTFVSNNQTLLFESSEPTIGCTNAADIGSVTVTPVTGATSNQMNGMNGNQMNGMNGNQMNGMNGNQMNGMNGNQMNGMNGNQMSGTLGDLSGPQFYFSIAYSYERQAKDYKISSLQLCQQS